jgi:Fe-S-cluster containining protein
VKAADAAPPAHGQQPDCFDTVEADGNTIGRGESIQNASWKCDQQRIKLSTLDFCRPLRHGSFRVASAGAGERMRSCMMCCNAPPIKALDKPAGKWCNAVHGKGCGIYEDRPAVCSAFYCEWMRNPGLGPEWKPDKAKFVVSILPNFPYIWSTPGSPNAWREPPYFAQITQGAVDSPAHGKFVLVRMARV